MKIAKIKRNVITLALFGGIATCGLGIYFIGGQTARAEVNLAPSVLQSEYAYGTVIDVPAGQLTVGDESFTVQPTVRTPQGTVRELTQLSLDEVGQYTLEYSVVKDGKYYSATDSFVVYDYTFSNSVTNAPLTYQKAVYTEITSGNQTAEVEIDGLAFSLKPSETVQSSQILNLNGCTKEDVLISIEATPVVNGVPDANELYVRFTDIYDENNHITAKIKRDPQDPDVDYSYVFGSYGAQPYLSYYNGIAQEHANYGTSIRNGMIGEWIQGHTAIDLFYDYEEKALYTRGGSGNPELVINFAQDFATAWQGFTTGEVYLTVWADAYETVDTTKPYNGMIMELYGTDLTAGMQENDPVSLYRVQETKAPSIDFGEYKFQKDIPDGMVGHPYSVFGSYGYSIYVQEEPQVRVYYGYYSSSRYVLEIENGAFVPQHDGMHTIEYIVTDIFGNKATKLVDVYVRKDVGKNFTLRVEDYEGYQTGMTGESVALPTVESVETEGQLGNVRIDVKAIHADGTEAPVENYAFLPKKGGEWTITYTATDAVQRIGSFSFKVQVAVNESVVFVPAEHWNDYAIVGAKNPIPVVEVVDYTLGGEVKPADKIYAKKGTQSVEISDGYFVPTEAGAYTIVYEATSSKNRTSQIEYSITAVDVGFNGEISMDKYFYSEGIVASETFDNYIQLSVMGNQKIDFIRPINGEEFFFDFNLEAGTAATAVELQIKDFNNPEQAVTLVFAKGDDGATLSVNGGRAKALGGLIFGGGADFPVSISEGKIVVDANRAVIETYANGAPFQGFGSQLVTLSVTIRSDSDSPIDFYVNGVSEQRFTNITEDYIAPTVLRSELLTSRILPGEEIKIPKVQLIDVLDPYVTASMTVYGPKGEVAKDVNGTLLEDVAVDCDYILKPTEIGTYTIVYNYADTAGNGGGQDGFRVITREKPIIQVSTDAAIGKVGKAITIRTATVESRSENVKLYIFVHGSESSLQELTKKENGEYTMQFTAKKAGLYKIRYLAVDEWNNISIVEYAITVS